MKKQHEFTIFILAFCASVLSLSEYSFAQEAPIPSVTFALVETRPASQPLTFLGRIESISFVDVRTRTEGFIQNIHFREGQMIEAGALLFEIDPSLHLARVQQSKAQVASAEAALNLAEIMLARIEPLARTRAVSQTDADRARADRDIARAQLAEANAALATVELDLSFTKVLAPIAGRVGNTSFDVGSFVNTASGSLVSIAQLDPIRVVISVRERDFIAATLNDGAALPLDLFGKDFSPQIRLANGKVYPDRGTLDSISNQIDIRTGTVEVRARFPNPAYLLLPGGTADVTLDAENPPMVPVVPAASLQQDQKGFFVLLITDDSTVEVRYVRLGRQMEQGFIVQEGLQAGDRVIVEGLQRVRSGVKVSPVPMTTITQ